MAIFTEWFQGISRSRSDQQGFANLVNCDVHSEIGYVTPQLALGVDGISGTPTEACIFAKTPAGTIYAFSKTTGKIWKLTAGVTWSVVTANANGANLGATYYNGYVYYATSTRLGRFVAETEASKNDSFGSFTQTSSYRPMEEVNLTLFIGNGKYVSSVNSAGTFADNAFDIPTNYTVTILASVGVDLLVGGTIGSYANKCRFFLWDTYSDTWTSDDEVPEASANCFIKNDDTLFAQCGASGQLYYWSGSAMVRFRKIPGVTTVINPYNTDRRQGRCLFATGTKIFSIHREDADLPYAIVQEYTTTSGDINSITTFGSQLIVSAGTHIDKTGTSYANATIDTPEVVGPVQNVIASYDSIGTGSSVGISVQIDNAGGFVDKTPITDTINKTVYFDGGLGTVNFSQGRITLTSATTNKVKLRAIELL